VETRKHLTNPLKGIPPSREKAHYDLRARDGWQRRWDFAKDPAGLIASPKDEQGRFFI
jgi:hypothetical protein